MKLFVWIYIIFCCAIFSCRSISSTQEIEINSQSAQKRDSVLLEGGSILGLAVSSGSFHKLTSMIQVVGLNEVLNQDGPYTLFAPTDEAFELFPEDTLNELLKPQNKARLIDLIKYHMVMGEIWTDSLLQLDTITTEQGTDLTIGESGYGIIINNAQVVKQNIKASNGVIQVIDRVLWPFSH